MSRQMKTELRVYEMFNQGNAMISKEIISKEMSSNLENEHHVTVRQADVKIQCVIW